MKCKLLIIQLLVTIFLGNTAFAQGKVTGLLQDPSGKPVPYATITLLNAKDSGAVAKKLTADNGYFSLEQVASGRYLVMASHVGFGKVYSNIFSLNNPLDSISLGAIRLISLSGNLKEVTVVGRKALIERKADRYVMDVENSALASGSSIQLLKTAPFVTVSPTKEITLQGKRTMILIDNKPVPEITLQDALQSLPAGEVMRVEFITEPSAKYDAAYGAVINIITKKSQTIGLTGSAWGEASWGKYGIYNIGTRLTYKHKNITVYGRIAYQRYNEWYYDEGIRRLTLNGSERVLGDSTVRLYNSDIVSFQAGAEYTIDKNQALGVEVAGNIRHTPGSFQTATKFSRPGAGVDSTLYTPGVFKNTGSTLNYNLNYRAKTAKGKGELIALLTYTPFTRDLKQDFEPYLVGPAKNIIRYPAPYRSTNPSDVNILIGQADYTHNLAKQWKLETGIKYQHSHTQNDVLLETKQNNEYIIDEPNSSSIELNESIYAAYGLVSKRWKKYFVQGGLRAEHTHAEAIGYFKKNYTDLFPNLFVQRSFSDDYKLSFAYRRQINRPPYQEVLPYTVIFDQYTISQGNPLLKPGYVSLFTLTGSLKKWTVALNFRHNSGSFIRLPSRQDTSGVTYYSLQNLRRMDTWSANIFYPLTITKWWTANNSITGGLTRSTGEVLSGTFKLSVSNWNFRSNHSFVITDKIKAEMSYYYISATASGLTKINSYTNMDVGVMFQVLSNKGQVRIGGEELFKRNVYYSFQQFGKFNKDIVSASDSRRVSISFRYDFGKTKITAPRKSLGNDDAIQRIK